jgi:hypothetical protein
MLLYLLDKLGALRSLSVRRRIGCWLDLLFFFLIFLDLFQFPMQAITHYCTKHDQTSEDAKILPIGLHQSFEDVDCDKKLQTQQQVKSKMQADERTVTVVILALI